MKPWAFAVGGLGLIAGFVAQPKPAKPWTIVVGGDVQGYLSPCGCTYPMSGGIRRWAAAVRLLGPESRTIVLENGGMVAGTGPQDRDKAEALAESLGRVHVAAINLTASEARFGPGEVSQLSQLAGAKFVSSVLEPKGDIGLAATVASGPLLIGGGVALVSTLNSVSKATGSLEEAASLLVRQARESKLVPVFMMDGDADAASKLALDVPGLGLIVYSRAGDPPFVARRVGKTMLVTPGEHGKFLVRLTFVDKNFSDYSLVDLGPSAKEDPSVGKIYAAYLRTVDRDNLIDNWPRPKSAEFAGSTRCGQCHASAFKVWSTSKHHGSYSDIVGQGHGKDPDCVVCHVTGLSFQGGFRDIIHTPDLAFVSCESCHGAGAQHAANPNSVKMPSVGKQACISCHDPENSPRFDFLTYWAQIKHR